MQCVDYYQDLFSSPVICLPPASCLLDKNCASNNRLKTRNTLQKILIGYLDFSAFLAGGRRSALEPARRDVMEWEREEGREIECCCWPVMLCLLVTRGLVAGQGSLEERVVELGLVVEVAGVHDDSTGQQFLVDECLAYSECLLTSQVLGRSRRACMRIYFN